MGAGVTGERRKLGESGSGGKGSGGKGSGGKGSGGRGEMGREGVDRRQQKGWTGGSRRD